MASKQRTCSECPNDITHRQLGSKTCGSDCRQVRSRRLRKARIKNGQRTALGVDITPLYHEVNEQEELSVARSVLTEEIRPVVREAITEEIFVAIQGMVGLTARAVQVLGEHLDSDDVNLQHKAASLVTRYTLGHPALVGPQDAQGQQLTVNFALPRPGVDAETSAEDAPLALQVCDTCGTEKPEDQFVANSDRCFECYDRRKAEVEARFGSQ